MKRRDFIKKSVTYSFATSALLTSGGIANILANNKTSNENIYDLAAIKGGEPDEMFRRAIEDLGGMKRFVQPNQTVVVKPNIGWDVTPERAANTNPKLVRQIIKSCFDAGAKDVYVFDHTCDNWKRCYSKSGIEKVVKEAGGKIVPGNNERYYHDVEIPKGKRLKNTQVHELILESDVFINVPVLKDHDSARLTIGMKNLMGIVWDRGYWHRNDLHQCIADFTTYRKPDLTVVDAYNVLRRNGPRGVSANDVLNQKSQIISTDIVAVDAASAMLFGLKLEEVEYINIADEMKLGTKDLKNLSISRIKL